NRSQKLRHVVEQSAKRRTITAVLRVDAGTTPVEERHTVACLAQAVARILIPAAVTLDAVQTDDVAARRRRRQVAPVAPAATVTGREGFERTGCHGFSQGAPPCEPSRAGAPPGRSLRQAPVRPVPVPNRPIGRSCPWCQALRGPGADHRSLRRSGCRRRWRRSAGQPRRGSPSRRFGTRAGTPDLPDARAVPAAVPR